MSITSVGDGRMSEAAAEREAEKVLAPARCPREGEGVIFLRECPGPKENTICLGFCPFGISESKKTERL